MQLCRQGREPKYCFYCLLMLLSKFFCTCFLTLDPVYVDCMNVWEHNRVQIRAQCNVAMDQTDIIILVFIQAYITHNFRWQKCNIENVMRTSWEHSCPTNKVMNHACGWSALGIWLVGTKNKWAMSARISGFSFVPNKWHKTFVIIVLLSLGCYVPELFHYSHSGL